MTPEEKKEYAREWYQKNRDERREYARRYKKEHYDKYLESQRRYYENHREKVIAKSSAYHKAHREQNREACRRYRAKKKLEKLIALQQEQLRKEAGYFKPKKESPIVGGKTFRLDTCPVCGSREVGRIGNKSYFCRSCFREITQHKIYYYDKEGIRRLES